MDGRVLDLVAGDVACYIRLDLHDDGVETPTYEAEFQFCEDLSLIGRRVRLLFEQGSVQSAACEGDPDCTLTETIPLVVEVTPLD